MMGVVHSDLLSRLIDAYRDDLEALDMIRDAVKAFEHYHSAVIEEQMFPIIYGCASDASDNQERRMELDKRRTTFHNSVIAYVRILNRMSSSVGLPPIYEGIVSEERHYRRQVADAVFSFLAAIIDERS